MRNIIINFVASKYEKNGKYGDYKERRPKNRLRCGSPWIAHQAC